MVMRRRGLGIHTKQKSEKISSGKKKIKVKMIMTNEKDFLYYIHEATENAFRIGPL